MFRKTKNNVLNVGLLKTNTDGAHKKTFIREITKKMLPSIHLLGN